MAGATHGVAAHHVAQAPQRCHVGGAPGDGRPKEPRHRAAAGLDPRVSEGLRAQVTNPSQSQASRGGCLPPRPRLRDQQIENLHMPLAGGVRRWR